MATDIGPRIGIDGESEFRKQLNNINTSIKTLGTEMKKVTSEFSDNANGQKALTAKNKVLNKSIEEQKKKLDQVTKALNESEKKYGKNSNETMKWQQVVNRTETELNSLEKELKQNNKALKEMDKGLRDTESGLSKVDKEAEKTKKSTSGFGESLKAAIVGGGIVQAIQAIGSAIANLVSETMEYRKIMSSLEVSSASAGYSAEQTTQTYKQLYAVLADDQTAATTTANLQALKLSQEQLTQITNGAIGAWARYGDSIPIDGLAESINETAKVGQVTGTFADVLNWAGTSEDTFNKKLEKAGSESERVNMILQELTNQGLISAGEAWAKNNEDIVKNNQATADLQGTMAQFAELVTPLVAGAKEKFNELLQSVLGVVNALKNGDMSGAISGLGDMFTNLAENMAGNIEMFAEMGEDIIRGITEGLQEHAPEVLDKVSEIVKGLAEKIPEFFDKGTELVQGLGDALAEFAPELVEKGFEMLQSIVQGIVDAIPTLVERVPEIVSTFANIINDNMPTILKKGFDLLVQLIKGIISAIPEIVKNIPKIIQAIIDVIMAFQWLSLGKNIIGFFKDGIMSMFGAVKNAGNSILNGIKDVIMNLPQTLKNIGKNAMTGLGNVISSLVGTVKNAAKKVASGVVDTIKELPDKLMKIGKDLVKGLWNGISDMTGWVLDKIKGFGKSITNGIKDFFGINSPSRLMRDEVGKFMAEGVGVGFVSEMKSVDKMIKKSLGKTVELDNDIAATAQNSFTVGIDYGRLEKMQGQGLYIDGKLLGRVLMDRGFVVA